jgi:hypothetical protein
MLEIFKREQADLQENSCVWALLVVGLLNSAVAAWSWPPHIYLNPSLRVLIVQSVWYALLPALTGIAASWIFARLFWAQIPLRFGLFAVYSGVAWLLVAPVPMLIERRSALGLVFMILAGLAMAACLRRFGLIREEGSLNQVRVERSGLFAGLPSSSSGMAYAFVIAVGLECALIPFSRQELFIAGLLLALVVFVLRWRLVAISLAPKRIQENQASAGLRVTSAFVLAVLMLAVAIRQHSESDIGDTEGANNAKPPGEMRPVVSDQSVGANGAYKGVILWTVAQKKEIVSPAPLSLASLNRLRARPVVIPFDGSYWYFQPPNESPGRDPHVAHGDPTAIDIRSTNRLPLMMEAHQSLGARIDLDCCGELGLNVRNGDNREGKVSLGVILTDSTLPGKPSLSLGGMPVASTQVDHFSIKSSPTEEVLRYPIPAQSKIRKFDQITVVFFPSDEWSVTGSKIAIQQFELVPR